MAKALVAALPAVSIAGYGLEEPFASALVSLLTECRKKGLDFRIAQGLRSPIVQAEYYCKWAKHPAALIDEKIEFLNEQDAPWLASLLLRFRDIPRQKAFVTGQLPGSGWHNWGLAADCYCYRNGKLVGDGSDPAYKTYADLARSLGLTAGYYFTNQDSGHVQSPAQNGASNIYSWKYIDEVMKARFEEKATVALKKGSSGATMAAGGEFAAEAVIKPPKPAARKTAAAPPPAAAVAAAPAIPPEAQESDIAVKGSRVTGPGGIVFGKISGPGLVNYGRTSIGDFFAQDPEAFPPTADSLIRVMKSVSENEGKIEAINTYDNAFLSCGIFQWTAGPDNGDGELAGLLDVLKSRSPDAFTEYFSSVGIGVDVPAHVPGKIRLGYLTLKGKTLKTKAQKAALRKHIWAYRFWRAAHDRDVRRAQIALAMERIGLFYKKPISATSPVTVASYVSSEYGVALLLDQHVNRPGHVPATLLKGVARYIAAGHSPDPTAWTTDDEAAVLGLYLAERAKTSMTNSTKRAEVTKGHADAGRLSSKRGSFQI